MQLQLGILVFGQDGERRVASTCADFKERVGPGTFLRDLVQDGEFLLQPLAVLEKVGCVVLVKEVPPFRGICIETV